MKAFLFVLGLLVAVLLFLGLVLVALRIFLCSWPAAFGALMFLALVFLALSPILPGALAQFMHARKSRAP